MINAAAPYFKGKVDVGCEYERSCVGSCLHGLEKRHTEQLNILTGGGRNPAPISYKRKCASVNAHSPPLPPSFNIDGQSLAKQLLKMFEMMRVSASILNVGVQGGGFQFSGGF